MSKHNLNSIGFSDRFLRESLMFEGLYPGRVSSQYGDIYQIITEAGGLTAKISGKLHHSVRAQSHYPAVGDFVMVDRSDNSDGTGIIHHILTRKSVFARKVAGTTNEAQIVAVNIDVIFICMSLNNDFNLRRLERYLSIAWDSGATPVVVLTKADLCEDVEAKTEEVQAMAIGVDIIVTTTSSQEGYLAVKSYISSGQTAAFIGSSGVGKSTLINGLLGQDLLATNEIRADHKGRHTTTRRELIPLPQGGAIIDTPGMRELGVIGADLGKSFADIEELATQCKFRDCTHGSEPNCAVQKAIAQGALKRERLASYEKLKKEATYDGLDSKQIEKEKINQMFSGIGGMKNARKYLKEQNRKKSR